MRPRKNYLKEGDDYLKAPLSDGYGELEMPPKSEINYQVRGERGFLVEGRTPLHGNAVDFGFLSALEPGEYDISIEIDEGTWMHVGTWNIVPEDFLKVTPQEDPSPPKPPVDEAAKFQEWLKGQTIKRIDANHVFVRIETEHGDLMEVYHGMDQLYFETKLRHERTPGDFEGED